MPSGVFVFVFNNPIYCRRVSEHRSPLLYSKSPPTLIDQLPDIITWLFQNPSSKCHCSLATCQMKVNTLPEMILCLFSNLLPYFCLYREGKLPFQRTVEVTCSVLKRKSLRILFIFWALLNGNAPAWEASCLLSLLSFYLVVVVIFVSLGRVLHSTFTMNEWEWEVNVFKEPN